MLKQTIFTVTGKTIIDEDVLVCRWLNFSFGEARLVIVPKKNAVPGAQRVLKIITDTLDTGPAVTSPQTQLNLSEITYSLDGDPSTNIFLPIANDGLDPYTQPKGGEKGNPDYIHVPQGLPQLPGSVADPNYLNLNPLESGGFPKASSGGNGAAGGKGGAGKRGQDAPVLEIWVKNIIGGKQLSINFKGQDGGRGGDGGNGQHGGNGERGSPSSAKVDVSWTWQPYGVCVQQPGMGGDGGNGGDAGCGGDGGDGGNGGFVKIFYLPTAAPSISSLIPKPLVQGGAGGDWGLPGKPGRGGEPGPPGMLVQLPGIEGICSAASESKRGDDGKGYVGYYEKEGGSPARKGKPGKEGGYFKQQVDAIPDFGLWI